MVEAPDTQERCDECGTTSSGPSRTSYPEIVGLPVFVFCCPWCKGKWLHKVIASGVTALRLSPRNFVEGEHG